ncbi:hypothetical protein C8F04DRAFT_1190070 [Mycena alexandri]|uniref:Uncharacterized protein n=1 Tax=Mycena alexandri TaxID=1745969 RepID=A0AAD6SFH4_9AGAR|nr:hypothetical protein C8F04DRAFT_1190070 [Mycena alexandri]
MVCERKTRNPLRSRERNPQLASGMGGGFGFPGFGAPVPGMLAAPPAPGPLGAARPGMFGAALPAAGMFGGLPAWLFAPPPPGLFGGAAPAPPCTGPNHQGRAKGCCWRYIMSLYLRRIHSVKRTKEIGWGDGMMVKAEGDVKQEQLQ